VTVVVVLSTPSVTVRDPMVWRIPTHSVPSVTISPTSPAISADDTLQPVDVFGRTVPDTSGTPAWIVAVSPDASASVNVCT